MKYLVEKATLVQAAANLSFSHVWSIAALSPAPGMPMQITSRVDIPCPTSPIISDITKLTGDELGSITYNIDEGVRAESTSGDQTVDASKMRTPDDT